MRIREYIFLAVDCAAVGVVITFMVLGVSARLGINILEEKTWILAVPAVLALVINIALLELYHRYRRRKG